MYENKARISLGRSDDSSVFFQNITPVVQGFLCFFGTDYYNG